MIVYNSLCQWKWVPDLTEGETCNVLMYAVQQQRLKQVKHVGKMYSMVYILDGMTVYDGMKGAF